MKIKEILLEEKVQEKILRKHRIQIDEINLALTEGRPKYISIKNNIYMAITCYNRYVTIIFEYKNQNAMIKTAYASSNSQIKRYKKK